MELYIYVGRPSCPDCEEFMPVLQQVVKNNHTVYYYNTDETREDTEHEALLTQLKVESVPILIKTSNGVVKDSMNLTTGQKKIEKFFYRSE